MRRNARRAADRAASTLLVFGVSLGLALGALPARADDAPADAAKAAGEVKAEEAKEHAAEAKEAGQAKAAEAKEEAAQAKEAGEAKAAEAKAKSKDAKTKAKSAKAKAGKAGAAKGGAVSEGTKAAGTMPVKPAVEPQHVQVQHILIAFAGSGTRATRPKEEAKKLAYEVLERARNGEDFDALVKQYTDDSPPGIYGMSGIGVPPGPGEYARNGMVPAFGNVGFAISPGNIGMADFDPQTSPYGWHIIKRLK
ncbi:MAG TPA: peptidylprolyl isomerase [Candidatus Eisenbacteria bacterium]|nr:peptidylprolyl isomerase [Candidatus Eisenbacteria bacterium]